MRAATSGATGVSSSASSGSGAAAASVPSAGATMRSGAFAVSRATSSRVRGPRKYDMAHRVEKMAGSGSRVLWSRNCRFPRPLIIWSIAFMSLPPRADWRASRIRALSRSVWRRPIIQVPVLDMAL